MPSVSSSSKCARRVGLVRVEVLSRFRTPGRSQFRGTTGRSTIHRCEHCPLRLLLVPHLPFPIVRVAFCATPTSSPSHPPSCSLPPRTRHRTLRPKPLPSPTKRSGEATTGMSIPHPRDRGLFRSGTTRYPLTSLIKYLITVFVFSFISLPIYFVRLDGKSEDFFSSPPKHPMQRRGEIDDKSALVDSINQTTITRSSRFPTAPANDRSPTKLAANALAQK